MHNRALHDSLAAFVEEAAWQLAAEVSGGAEIPFELIEQGRSSAPLYCYRPQTEAFIAQRAGELAKLPTYPAARQGLEALAGLEGYLRGRGVRALPPDQRTRGDLALQVFLTAVWADATDFVFERARFDAAFADLERAAYSGAALTQVLAPVDGLVIESERVELGGGLALVRASTLRDAPAELHVDAWATVAAVSVEAGPGEAPALEGAGRRLRRLQTSLRLWDDAEPAVGPSAWARTGTGPWLHVPLATGLRRSGPAVADCLLAAEEEDPLRAFCALVDRRTPRGGELAWSLRRFELGCERPTALEALTDWLLAARALLAEPGQAGYERVPDRLAAICAHPGDRPALVERLTRAIALERAAIAGLVRPEPEIEDLVASLGGCMRAVLRDVLCGHLDPDLRRVADGLLDEPALA
ncbi:MAG TPA: hypothetical protein VM266_14430 [Solirubrobacteraceae bacterium]|nr:hypothetical protein [Solirubrobacteraceae bacterium]